MIYLPILITLIGGNYAWNCPLPNKLKNLIPTAIIRQQDFKIPYLSRSFFPTWQTLLSNVKTTFISDQNHKFCQQCCAVITRTSVP